MSVFKTDEEVEKLLAHPNNGINKIKAAVDVKIKTLGTGNHGNHDRGNGKKNGNQLRAVEDKADVGVLANLVGNKAAGQLLGVGSTQVSEYKHGRNGSHKSDPNLKSELESRLSFLEEKAVDKVELFLEMISEEKALEMKAGEMASSAEKMVNVLDKLRRRNDKDGANLVRPQIIIHGPALVKSDNYIVKEV